MPTKAAAVPFFNASRRSLLASAVLYAMKIAKAAHSNNTSEKTIGSHTLAEH